MAKIVNLRLARKKKARADKNAKAAENRAMHGRAKSERLGTEAERARRERGLDGARRGEE